VRGRREGVSVPPPRPIHIGAEAHKLLRAAVAFTPFGIESAHLLRRIIGEERRRHPESYPSEI
jgi:hypothetical protein